jgi:hypothetical protein
VYRHWSDEITEINGAVHGSWFSAWALAVDISIVAAAVIASLAAPFVVRRGGARAARGGGDNEARQARSLSE